MLPNRPMQQNNSALTGGCQCGAVRFRVERLGGSSICHCRMCQKAFGSAFGPLVSSYGLVWTRGEPKRFQSSNKVLRGFCAECGTPLTYELVNRSPEEGIEVAIGSFDDPELAAPTVQVNPDDKLAFFDTLTQLPVRTGGSASRQDAFNAGVISYQHPDHDTSVWPQPQAQS
ncbi:MAG: aldehyde-activating protein [Hyphomicrobiales bacterium]|nr:aldehyde-activating protein [Hyphomicrobiales bacterium]